MQVSASRVVAFVVTPVLTAGSLVAAPWLVKTTGLKVTPAELTADGVAAATLVAGACIKWLHGLSLWERGVKVVDKGAAAVDKVDPGIVGEAEQAGESAVKEGVAKLVAVIEPADPPPAEAPAGGFPPPPAPATPEPEAAA